MKNKLKQDLRAYAKELQGAGPTVNYTHQTLARLWQEHGRKAVEKGIATMPEFKQSTRQIYSIL